MTDEFSRYLDRSIYEAHLAKLVELGYWCPRCECEAHPNPPLTVDEPLGSRPGWCPICGLDPNTPGPAPTPAVKRGILETDETSEDVLAELWEEYGYAQRNPGRYQRLDVDDHSTLLDLVPGVPRATEDVPLRFMNFPVVVDETLPKGRIHLVDHDGRIVKAWTVTS